MGAAARRRRLAMPGSGIEIALLEWDGDGPLVLLHHANGFCAGVWGLVAEGLRGRYRVAAFDARGHGDSSKPAPPEPYRWDRFIDDLVQVAETLAAESDSGRVAVGVGHSFGGTAMLGAAARRSGLFERLVLVDPVIPPAASSGVDAARKQSARRLAAAARRRRRAWSSRRQALASWAKRPFFSSWAPRALELYAAEGLREYGDGRVELKCPPEIEAAIFEASGSFDAFAAAERVACPTRILWARRGDFPRALYETLAAAMPAARVLDVDAGHLVPMERPELVIRSVKDAPRTRASRDQRGAGPG